MDWIYQEVLTLQTLTELDGFVSKSFFLISLKWLIRFQVAAMVSVY
jgi:hypothetical protein